MAITWALPMRSCIPASAAIEHEQGITVRVAYNLDGGYSSAMVLHNEKINWPENGVNREVSDIVYFASAWQKE